MLKNQFTELGIELGENLLPFIVDIMQELSELAKWFGSLDAGTQKLIISSGLLTFALGGIGKTVGGVISGVGSTIEIVGKLTSKINTMKTATEAASTANKAMGASSAVAFGGVGLAIAGVSIAAMALMNHFSKTKEESDNLVTSIRQLNDESNSLQELKDKFVSLNKSISDGSLSDSEMATKKKELKSVYESLIGKVPELEGLLSDETLSYDKQAKAIQNVVNAKKEEAQIKAQKYITDKNVTDDSVDKQIEKLDKLKENQSKYSQYATMAREDIVKMVNEGRRAGDVEFVGTDFHNIDSDKAIDNFRKKFKDLANDTKEESLDIKKTLRETLGNENILDEIGMGALSNDTVNKIKALLTSLGDSSNSTDKASDSTARLTNAMTELNSKGSLSQSTIDSLNKSFPNLKLGTEDAKASMFKLNSEMSNQADKTKLVEQATKGYMETLSSTTSAINGLQEIQSHLSDKGLTDSDISKIKKEYPELLAYMNNREQMQDAINKKIEDEKNKAIAAYRSMLMSDSDYYKAKIKNSNDCNQIIEKLNYDLYSSFGNDYKFDLKNYGSMEAAKLEMTKKLIGELAAAWQGYFDPLTGDLIDGYDKNGKLTPFESDASHMDQNEINAILETQAKIKKMKEAMEKIKGATINLEMPDFTSNLKSSKDLDGSNAKSITETVKALKEEVDLIAQRNKYLSNEDDLLTEIKDNISDLGDSQEDVTKKLELQNQLLDEQKNKVQMLTETVNLYGDKQFQIKNQLADNNFFNYDELDSNGWSSEESWNKKYNQLFAGNRSFGSDEEKQVFDDRKELFEELRTLYTNLGNGIEERNKDITKSGHELNSIYKEINETMIKSKTLFNEGVQKNVKNYIDMVNDLKDKLGESNFSKKEEFLNYEIQALTDGINNNQQAISDLQNSMSTAGGNTSEYTKKIEELTDANKEYLKQQEQLKAALKDNQISKVQSTYDKGINNSDYNLSLLDLENSKLSENDFKGQADIIKGQTKEIQNKIVSAFKEISDYQNMLNNDSSLTGKQIEEIQNKIGTARNNIVNFDKELVNLNKSVKSVYKSEQSLLENMSSQLTSLYKNYLDQEEKKTEEIFNKQIDNINKIKNAYNKALSNDNAQKEIDEAKATLLELQNEKATASKLKFTDSGKARYESISKQVEEQQKKVDELVAKNEQDKQNDKLDQQIQDLQTKKDATVTAFKKEWSDTKIAEIVQKALSSGTIQTVTGEVISLQDAFVKWSNQFNDGMSITGKRIKTEFVDNFKELKNVIDGISLDSLNSQLTNVLTNLDTLSRRQSTNHVESLSTQATSNISNTNNKIELHYNHIVENVSDLSDKGVLKSLARNAEEAGDIVLNVIENKLYK
jgi:hypothetical protein